MNDVVAIKVRDLQRGNGYFLTWGRVFSTVDPKPLLKAVRKTLKGMDFSEIVELEVCSSLSEATQELYFYESLLRFAWEKPPFGSTYAVWAKKKREEIASGKE